MQCLGLHLLGCIYLAKVCSYHTDHMKGTSLSEASNGKLRAKQKRVQTNHFGCGGDLKRDKEGMKGFLGTEASVLLGYGVLSYALRRRVTKDNSKHSAGLGQRRGLLEQVLAWQLTDDVATGCTRPYDRFSAMWCFGCYPKSTREPWSALRQGGWMLSLLRP